MLNGQVVETFPMTYNGIDNVSYHCYIFFLKAHSILFVPLVCLSQSFNCDNNSWAYSVSFVYLANVLQATYTSRHVCPEYQLRATLSH